MFRSFVYYNTNKVDKKENWNVVLVECEDNKITLSFVASAIFGTELLEGKVVEMTDTAEEFMRHFRGYVDLAEEMHESQRRQHEILAEVYLNKRSQQ